LVFPAERGVGLPTNLFQPPLRNDRQLSLDLPM
jgi:hypothetical protein